MIGFLDSVISDIQNNIWYSMGFLGSVSVILYLLTSRVALPVVHFMIKKSPTQWDDMLIRRKVLEKLVWFPSLVFLNHFVHLLGPGQAIGQKIIHVLFAWSFILGADRFLVAINDVYETLSISKGNPIKGFVQVLEILVFLFGGIVIIAILMNKSPWMLLSGLGAMTAILLLIFKDTIMSLVASVRITSHKLIEIGDWIEMPQFGADGDVIDIALHSIQVQNWDKTITSIPTHKLIDESFKNWKGMVQSGGRRIMRNLNVDVSSVRFCDDAQLEKFESIELLRDYLQEKKKEISEYNKSLGIDEHDYTNGRHMTNLGTFRAYIEKYLRQHPGINQDMIMMTRQMPPDSTGVPLQLYAFTSTTAWVEYEGIQADIFDHLLAIAPEFSLRVFQYPTGSDLGAIKTSLVTRA